MDAYETLEREGYKAKVVRDEDPDDPRSWDILGHMVCFHRRYILGDKHEYKSEDFSSRDEIEARIQEDTGGALVLPLYLYDHGGITMNTTGFSCPWDSGQVGFIYMRRADALKEWPEAEVETRALGCLRGEVETYDQFLTGQVYGYVIEDPEGNELDSCWGFYGLADTTGEAQRSLDWMVEHAFMPTI